MALPKLRHEVICDRSVHVGESEVPPLVFEGQFLMVQAHEMEKRCIKVMHVQGLCYGRETELIGLTVGNAGLDTSSGQPDGKTFLMMVPTHSSLPALTV